MSTLKQIIMKKNNLMFKNHYLKNKWLWLIFILFIAISFYGLTKHQPWRDEAQAWLLVRDLSTVEIINQMPYEGTPPLWHLLISPLIKSGLPYKSMLYLHYFLGVSLIFLFLFFSPLPKIVKFILPFNYYFIFEYIIVARNYNLTALILFLLAILYKKRWHRPWLYGSLIFLLAWTNVHSLALAGTLFALLCYDLWLKNKNKQEIKKSFWVSLILAFLGLLSAVLIMLPQANQVSALKFSGFLYTGKALAVAILPLLVHFHDAIFSTGFYWLFAIAWLILISAFLQSWKSKFIFTASLFWLTFIFTFKNSGDLRHYGLILIFFIFAWWLDITESAKRKKWLENINQASAFIILTIFLLTSAGYGLFFYNYSKQKDFSGSYEMAQYLLNNPHLLEQEIATFPSYSGSALLPYLPNKNFYQLETFREGTFLTWDNIFVLGQSSPYYFLKEEMKKYYLKKDSNLDEVLFLTIIPPGLDPELELLHQNTKSTIKHDEFFYLYKLKLKQPPL